MIERMAMEKSTIVTMTNSKVNLLMDQKVVMVHIYIMMEPSLKENLMVMKKLKDVFFILMEINI